MICAAPASIVSFHFFSFPFSRAVLGGNQKQNFPKSALFFLKTSAGTSEIFHRKFFGGFYDCVESASQASLMRFSVALPPG